MFAVPTVEATEHQVTALSRLVAGLVPGEVELAAAPALWAAFDALERLAGAAKTLLASRVEESASWRATGARSAADHLAQASGCSVTAARQMLATSARLAQLPATETALRRGDLSSAQADAITDAATMNPPAEARLSGPAGRSSLAELRQECARAKAAGDPDPDRTHRRIHRARRLAQHTDAEGAWCMHARGTTDAGAVINTALEPIIGEIFELARKEDRHEPARPTPSMR
jgi:hypothetical protein